MTSEVGSSRKAKIATYVANGSTNFAIWRAMEGEYPQIIKDDVARKEACMELEIPFMPFDAVERDNVGKAIRQIKGLMLKEDLEMFEDAGDVESPSDIERINRHRFSSGMASLDYMYGRTVFRWLSDAPDSKYTSESYQIIKDGQKVTKERRLWVSGSYKLGDMMPNASCGDQNWKPGKNQSWTVNSADEAYIETGLPEAFMSLWGGAPGVGKTRLAIRLGKSLNKLNHSVMYFNGEAAKQDFRMWLGNDVDNDLFQIVSGEQIRTANAVQKIYKHKPKVVIFDSFQMLVEVSKGGRGAKQTLSAFKVLKSDPEAGCPHLIFISQLNKKGDMAGSRYLEHIVDAAAYIKHILGRKNQFVFEIPGKNRGGETGKQVTYKHTENGIISTSEDIHGLEPLYKSLVVAPGSAIAQGIVAHSVEESNAATKTNGEIG